ncbi:G-type lectin S-receptor-like serine/threonine-protein kinase SD3-1 [Typha angustifolia]|uniref:G-type lectin S-receptor-like serine/threonine-protein kinase SD3-1 n=1 Tax=Typha angustifolia TaxID=59011 RepID=UPI003C2CBD45
MDLKRKKVKELLQVNLFAKKFWSKSQETSPKEAFQIPLGSKLLVEKHEWWTSSNGNFALGFFNNSDRPYQYSTGIRFNSGLIPSNEQALVWVAGAGISVGCKSYLHLTDSGELLLFDSSKGVVVWSSDTCNSSVSFASLLDDGNFVLFGQDQDIVWQSFKTPSDTLLPGQNLTSLQSLRSANGNSVSSCYSLTMDTFGQLKLRWENNVTYWRTEVASVLPIISAVFTKEGSFQLLDAMSRQVWSVYGDDHKDSNVRFRFLRMDSDGNLRMYSWAKSSKSWRRAWQAVANQCDVFATCGSSGVCMLTSSGNTTCKCPFGSSPNTSYNCLAPYNDDCKSGTSMLMLKHTFLYGIYPPEDSLIQSSAEKCRSSCLQDPKCTAVTVTNDGEAQCRIKKTRFITGHEQPSLSSVSFVKICLDPVAVALPVKVHPPSSPSSAPLHRRSNIFYIISIFGPASGTLVAILMIQLIIFLYFIKKRRRIRRTRTAKCPFQCSVGLVALSYSELKDITSNFKHQLGQNLFKGVLRTNQVVVVKELNLVTENGENLDEKQFRSWVGVLGCIHHKNLVKLEGYCCNSSQRFLVYEFHKNASVDRWIKEPKLSKRFTWKKRMEICIGVAKAISYLHSGCREFVCHGNLRWENVLLDEELEAKVSYFGLTRFGGKTSPTGEGAEVDVAMFGEMILTMVTGCQDQADLFSWAYTEWVEGHGLRVVDSRIGGKFDGEEVERMLRISFWCLQTDTQRRPSMGEVLKVLEGTLSVDPPPPLYPSLDP